MASDKNLILGAAMAAPKFNTGFVDIIDREVKEFTTRVEKEAKEKQARADAISADTASFIEGLPGNPGVELLDKSLKSSVEAFLAQKRTNLAGLFRTRRGDTVTYAPGTEAYDKITREMESEERAINNVLNQLKIHQANKADFIREQNTISNYWKTNNLDMFDSMKNIYLEETYGNNIDTNGNITINGKYKITDWESGENIKRLDWGLNDSGYLSELSKQFDASSSIRGQKMQKGDSYDQMLSQNLRNYFAAQADGGKDAITSIVFDNAKILGLDLLQDKEQIDKLKGLINNKNYNEAIENVVSSSMDRVITHQNNLYDKANDDGRGTQTERDRQALLDYLKKTDSTRVDIVKDYGELTKIKENGVFESYTKLENKLSQYGIIVNPITDTSGKNILQLELINQRNGVRSLLFGNMTDNQILAALDGAFGAFARGIDYESIPLNLRIK